MTDASATLESDSLPPPGAGADRPTSLQIKRGLILLALFVLLVVSCILPFLMPQAEEDGVLSVADTDALGVTPIPEDIVTRAKAASSVAPGDANAAPELGQVKFSLERLEDRLRDVESTLANAQPSIRGTVAETKRLDAEVQRIAGELGRVSASLAELVAAVDEFGVRLAVQDEQAEKFSRHIERSRRMSATRREGPAFSLLSIDRWGGEESAVLDLDGRITTASVGDSRAGWTLRSIHRPGCIDVERDSDRKSASVCISRGGI